MWAKIKNSQPWENPNVRYRTILRVCTVNVNSSIQIRGKIRRFVVKEFVKLSDEQETDEKTKKEETI